MDWWRFTSSALDWESCDVSTCHWLRQHRFPQNPMGTKLWETTKYNVNIIRYRVGRQNDYLTHPRCPILVMWGGLMNWEFDAFCICGFLSKVHVELWSTRLIVSAPKRNSYYSIHFIVAKLRFQLRIIESWNEIRKESWLNNVPTFFRFSGIGMYK